MPEKLIVVNKFKDYCEKNRWKVVDVAEGTGLSMPLLYSFGNHNTNITIQNLKKICEYLNCKLSDIIEFKKEGK